MGNSNAKPVVYTDQVNLAHFKLLRVVGKGAFGKVRIVERKDDRLTFALKYIRKDEVVRAENVRNIIRERRMLEHLNHPFLCNLRYSFQDFEYLYLVVDLMNGGDLRFHITRKTFTEQAVRFWIAELGCAVRYIHSQGIVHRDIKPDNVLLDSDGHVHLADFNVAANFKERSLSSKSGTLAYLAPEVYEGKRYKSEVDWWGLGVLFYECIYGKRPFLSNSHDELAKQVIACQPKYPRTQPQIDTRCVTAIKRLMCKEVHDRIGAIGWETFTQHPFFIDIDFNALERKEILPIFIPSSDKTNFDATYDLEELLLEDAPLEARAKHQKPRPQLKSDASPQEVRMAELHLLIEKHFEPFDYKLASIEDEEQAEKSAMSALATLPSDAGKVEYAMKEARRISASSTNRKKSTQQQPSQENNNSSPSQSKSTNLSGSSVQRPESPQLLASPRSATYSPGGTPPFSSQVSLPGTNTNHQRSATEVSIQTSLQNSETLVAKPAQQPSQTPAQKAAAKPVGTPIRVPQRSHSIGHVGMIDHTIVGRDVRPPKMSMDPASIPIGRSLSPPGTKRRTTEGPGPAERAKGFVAFLSRRKRDRSNHRKAEEPGVLGKLGARQVIND